jgi:hypothetical protein
MSLRLEGFEPACRGETLPLSVTRMKAAMPPARLIVKLS